jgi:hypothetical protein
MSPGRILLTLAMASLVHGGANAQKGPVELQWRTADTVRRRLVVTPLRVRVNWTGQPRHLLDVSSVGAEDTARAALPAGFTGWLPQREFFSAPVNDSGVITIETKRAADASSFSSSIVIPYTAKRTGALFDLLRATTTQPDFDPTALRLATFTAEQRDGYSGSVQLHVVPNGTGASALRDARLRLRALGGVTILSDQSLVGLPSLADTAPAGNVSFAIPIGAKGIIEADVTLPNVTVGSQYRASRLYFLAGLRRLYIGTLGFAALEIEQLQEQRAARELNGVQYDRRLHEILGRGTQQTIIREPNR